MAGNNKERQTDTERARDREAGTERQRDKERKAKAILDGSSKRISDNFFFHLP